MSDEDESSGNESSSSSSEEEEEDNKPGNSRPGKFVKEEYGLIAKTGTQTGTSEINVVQTKIPKNVLKGGGGGRDVKVKSVGASFESYNLTGDMKITVGLDASRSTMDKSVSSSKQKRKSKSAKPVKNTEPCVPGTEDVTLEDNSTTDPLNKLVEIGNPESKGLALIINIKEYKDSIYTRIGADIDTKSLKDTFNRFKMRIFCSESEYGRIKKEQISEWIKEFKSKFKKGTHDYCIVVIMGHGTSHDYLMDSYLQNMDIQTGIFDPFDNNEFEAMVDKPKIFIMQCCRGVVPKRSFIKMESVPFGPHSESTQLVDSDSQDTLAGVSDLLVIWATVKGSSAFRNEEYGSYFIQEFCQVLNGYAESLNTRRNYKEEFGDVLRELKGEFRKFSVQMPVDVTQPFAEVPCSQPVQIVDTLFGRFYLKLNGLSDYEFD